MKRLPFIPQLDSFRFFSVLLVIVYHWLPNFKIFAFGDVGVGFFFVLSGYLISGNLLYLKKSIDSNEITSSNALLVFYYRRTLRIFPLYYMVLLFLFLLIPAVFAGNEAWYFSYAPNLLCYHKQEWPGMLSPFWSLGIEEQFYLLWPMLIFTVPWRHLKKLFVGTVIASIFFKLLFPIFYPNRFTILLPISQFDAFAMGAILAYLPFTRYSAVPTKANTRIILFILCFLLAATARSFTGISFLFNLGLSGCAVLIIQQAQKGFPGFLGKILDLPILQYLGKISYGLYVYHNFMPWLWRCLKGQESSYPLPIVLFKGSWAENPWVNLLAQLSLLLIITSLSWFLFEKPINGLKNSLSIGKKRALRLQQ